MKTTVTNLQTQHAPNPRAQSPLDVPPTQDTLRDDWKMQIKWVYNTLKPALVHIHTQADP